MFLFRENNERFSFIISYFSIEKIFVMLNLYLFGNFKFIKNLFGNWEVLNVSFVVNKHVGRVVFWFFIASIIF